MLEDVERIEVDQRPRRDAVGRQRRQRRHQHHHASARRRRRACSVAGGGGNLEAGGGRALRRRRCRRRRPLPRLRQVLRPRRTRRSRAARRSATRRSAGRRASAPTGTGATDSRHRAGRRVPRRHRPGAGGARRSTARTCSPAGRASFADGSSARVQAYYDRTHRDQPQSFEETSRHRSTSRRSTASPSARTRSCVGGGYRCANDRVENSAQQAFLPPTRTLRWANAFVQDRIDAVADRRPDARREGRAQRLHRRGVPAERAARLAADAVAAAVGRPRRARCARRRASTASSSSPARRRSCSSATTRSTSEIANVYEVGYRAQPTPALSYSVTVFYHDYSRLRSQHRITGRPDLRERDRRDDERRRGVGRVARAADVAAVRGRRRAARGPRRRARARWTAASRSSGTIPPVQWQIRSTVELPAQPGARPRGAPRRRAAGPDGAVVHRGRRAAGRGARAPGSRCRSSARTCSIRATSNGAAGEPRGVRAQRLRQPAMGDLARRRLADRGAARRCAARSPGRRSRAGALAAATAAAQPAVPLERTVKAAFVYKFVPYVEWPLHAFDGARRAARHRRAGRRHDRDRAPADRRGPHGRRSTAPGEAAARGRARRRPARAVRRPRRGVAAAGDRARAARPAHARRHRVRPAR